MDVELFDYSSIVDREPIEWPDGARVAFYVGLNVEHCYPDRPSTSLNEATASLVPDPLNYGWRDYGARVGIWRVIECLDRHGIRASALLNSNVCGRYPQIIDAGRDRSWAWVAHGKTNSVLHAGMAAREERALLAEVVGTWGPRDPQWVPKATASPARGQRSCAGGPYEEVHDVGQYAKDRDHP